MLQVGVSAQSPYELRHHVPIGTAHGRTPDGLRGVTAPNGPERTALGPLEAAAVGAGG